MNTVNRLVIAAISLLMPALAHASGSDVSDYLTNARRGPGIPVPVAIVAPELRAAPAGARAEITLVVDATGRPTQVAVKSATDRALARAAAEAVKRWRFEPAMVNGAPRAVKVMVPFHVGRAIPADGGYAAR